MKRIFAIAFALCIITAMFAGCAQAGGNTDTPTPSVSAGDNSWDTVAAKGELVLGLDDGFPPMGYRDENGEIIGFDIDLAKEVCSRLGISLKLQAIDWKMNVQELSTGNVDCLWNGFTITDERKKNVLFTDSYMSNRQIIVVLKSSPYNTLADLAGKKLGYQSGSSAADALDASAQFKSSLKEAVALDTNTTALLDLENGGLDAVLVDEIVANHYMTAQKKPFRILNEALAPEQYGIGFRLGEETLMNKIQDTLKAMAQDGKLAEISIKWFGKDITTIGK